MAQWSRADRTIYTKIVYYGPAFGGKTTNLVALHRITDPQQRQQLLTIKTADDRTLFFDLLPFDLGDILGYRVAMKLYTVPGQVRYDTTRQIVLSGADAVVFVADSAPGRREQNRWARQNLQINLKARGLDPTQVPIVYQINKQDLQGADSPAEVANSLGVDPGEVFGSIATEGTGVMETFVETSRRMIRRLVDLADARTRKEIDVSELDSQIDACFAPYLERTINTASGPPEAGDSAIVLDNGDLLQDSLEAGLRLGEKLSAESSRAIRLEREAEALRRMSESLRQIGANFDQRAIIDAALTLASEILEAPVASLVSNAPNGRLQIDRVHGGKHDPLIGWKAGSALLHRMQSTTTPCVVANIASECGATAPPEVRDALRGVMSVPVEAEENRRMVVYSSQPDGQFDQEDVRFLATLAGHLGVGLEKARTYEELALHREQLEKTVESRTSQLCEANRELQDLAQTKERFLAGVSHEMKTPLTAILSAAVCLRDYPTKAAERKEMVDSVILSCQTLQSLLDNLFRLTDEQQVGVGSEAGETTTAEVILQAIELAGCSRQSIALPKRKIQLKVDGPRLTRALANLIDNAVKFSDDPQIQIVIKKGRLRFGNEAVPGVSISVLDRGPGVPAEDRERIFQPFEQGGDPMTSKPRGIGLGLHESRMIARRHGGVLECLDRKGGGCEMRLSLPLEPAVRPEPIEVPVGA